LPLDLILSTYAETLLRCNFYWYADKYWIEKKYSKIVEENKELITKGVELNPREVKRFITNFVVAYVIYSGTIRKVFLATLMGSIDFLVVYLTLSYI
jgi:hypothetical protein